jgi:hypothetical protein
VSLVTAPRCSMPELQALGVSLSCRDVCCDVALAAPGAAGPGRPLLAPALPHCTAVSSTVVLAHHATTCTVLKRVCSYCVFVSCCFTDGRSSPCCGTKPLALQLDDLVNNSSNSRTAGIYKQYQY